MNEPSITFISLFLIIGVILGIFVGCCLICVLCGCLIINCYTFISKVVYNCITYIAVPILRMFPCFHPFVGKPSN